MAAAYAALLSLTHLIDHIQLFHGHQPFFLDKQLRQLESLRVKVRFLQDFLEHFPKTSSYELSESFKSGIVDEVYASEDLIDSYIADGIHACLGKKLEKRDQERIALCPCDMTCTNLPRFTSMSRNKKTSSQFSQCLQKVIENMDFFRRSAIDIQEKNMLDCQYPHVLIPISSLGLPPTEKGTVVEFEALNHILSKIASGQSENHTISITGVGGIGKTTLAKIVYGHPIAQHFGIRCWVRIFQEGNMRKMWCDFLDQVGVHYSVCDEEHKLGKKLYKYLSRKRYLIIIDNMWSVEIWDELRRFFPVDKRGSSVIITTRLIELVDRIGSSNISYKINVFDEEKSWTLFSKKVSCPPELKEVGERIVRNCKGLPLSIYVVGGLLAKSPCTQEYWEYVDGELSKAVNPEDEDRCLNTLSLSYNHLPIHLKPCFLYLGTYPEYHEIKISELIKLWVAEGFLRPTESNYLEDVAEDYVKDLVDRNLIFVGKWGSTGKIKTCKVHDLLRDLCLREAHKEGFFCVIKEHRGYNITSQCRTGQHIVVIDRSFTAGTYRPDPSTRSVISNYMFTDTLFTSKLLRVLNSGFGCIRDVVCQQVNSRYINVGPCGELSLPSSIYLLWNLQTLILQPTPNREIYAPPEIWEMPQLRHVICGYDGIKFPDFSGGQRAGHGDVVMENLQTLSGIWNLRFNEKVVRKISNIRKLKIWFHIGSGDASYYCLNNLSRLQNLQTLDFRFPDLMIQDIEFPSCLKKLTLTYCSSGWEEISKKIGSLPNLEKLKLTHCGDNVGKQWNAKDGQFIRLKYMKLRNCCIEHWNAESNSFPCLGHLVLFDMCGLKEIPSGVGDITTLESIYIWSCNDSVIVSAKRIWQEQRSLGNDGCSLYVGLDRELVHLESAERKADRIRGEGEETKVKSEED